VQQRVVVTGLVRDAARQPSGGDCRTAWRAFRDRAITRFDSPVREPIAGEVKGFDGSLYIERKNSRKWTASSSTAWLRQMALDDADSGHRSEAERSAYPSHGAGLRRSKPSTRSCSSRRPR